MGVFPQIIQEDFIRRVAIKEHMKVHRGRLNIEFLSDAELLKLTFHSKAMLRQLLIFAKNGGLKKGDLLSCDEK